MNNEPVAWMVNNKSYEDIFEAEHYSKFTNKPMIPLYTHPVKEQLTDEEIADFLYAYCLDMGDVYEASEEQFIKCVRAILRKAQEK